MHPKSIFVEIAFDHFDQKHSPSTDALFEVGIGSFAIWIGSYSDRSRLGNRIRNKFINSFEKIITLHYTLPPAVEFSYSPAINHNLPPAGKTSASAIRIRFQQLKFKC